MALEINCLKIADDINESCAPVQIGDYKQVGVLIPFSLINRSTIVENGCNVDFDVYGGAIKIYDTSFKPFDGTQVTEELKSRFMQYNELVVFPAFERKPENADLIYKLSAGIERFVVLLEQEKVNSTGSNRFQCFGLQSGLRFKEKKSDIENQTANLVSLEQMNAGLPARFYFDTNDATTIAKVDAMVSTEAILGLTIGNGTVTPQNRYLEVDSDKTCYIVTPEGTLLTSTSGFISGTYTGLGGKTKLIIPKDTALLRIGYLTRTDISGCIESDTTASTLIRVSHVDELILNNVTELDCSDNTSIEDVTAPKATTIIASGCALTAKSIGDFLIAASINNPTASGTAVFSGGTNADKGAIRVYMESVLGITIISLSDWITANLATWTITYNE